LIRVFRTDRRRKMEEKSISGNNVEHELTDSLAMSELDIPEETSSAHKEIIAELSTTFFGMVMQNAPESNISKKLTEEHISQYLKDSGDNMRLTHKSRFQTKIIVIISMVLILGFFTGIMVIFKDTPDIVEKIMFTAGGAIVGAIGGFGFGKSKKD